MLAVVGADSAQKSRALVLILRIQDLVVVPLQFKVVVAVLWALLTVDPEPQGWQTAHVEGQMLKQPMDLKRFNFLCHFLCQFYGKLKV